MGVVDSLGIVRKVMGHRTWMGESRSVATFNSNGTRLITYSSNAIEGANRKACEYLVSVTESGVLRTAPANLLLPKLGLGSFCPNLRQSLSHCFSIKSQNFRSIVCISFSTLYSKSLLDKISMARPHNCEAALTLIATSLIGTLAFLRYTRSVMNAEAG